MLKDGWKQYLVLAVFSLLLRDILTSATLTFVTLGLSLVILGFKTNSLVRNALAIGVFASYWIQYGKIIDPEIGLNFLTSIIVLKILEKEALRDRYMIFFGLILLISAGSLFESNLTYVFFFLSSFILLISDFYVGIGQRWKTKEFLLTLAWVAPITGLFFFLVPRLMSPIPFNRNTLLKGEIGYTPDVNISQIDSLEPNKNPVFQVKVSRPLQQNEIYWRGNTLSFNDGWNWRVMPQDKDTPPLPVELGDLSSEEVDQKFRLFSRSDFLFGLDVPETISYTNESFRFNGSLRTFSQQTWDWIQNYSLRSIPQKSVTEQKPKDNYLRVPLSRKEKEKIRALFSGTTVSEVGQSIQNYFLKEKYTYTFTPGRIESLDQFMEKKVGMCSHYASAAALFLRMKGIPTRLVSGFLGGSFNPYAHFYLVTQNDAHVWIEAFENNRWIRLDPTQWIAPDRIRLGGESFMESRATGGIRLPKLVKIPEIFFDLKQWLAQWDFRFYQWLEQMDYQAQSKWLSKLKIKREWLFSIIPLILVLFMVLYTWYLSWKNGQRHLRSRQEELWDLFFRKAKNRDISLSRINLKDSYDHLNLPENQDMNDIFQDLMALSFKGNRISEDELEKKIKRL